jgi:hypothetical protein
MARIMDMAYLRDGKLEHDKEALMVACLLRVKKRRGYQQEEELKDLLDVF